ncbi:MAG: hypothetical protein C6I00_00335 [Nitratiruptor sp.]|nr:hypothetical protein [Nitratiruptor sp.]NPA83692.1 DUF3108 domain-containing protein [Campylobacterota bacterium]
MRPLLFVLICTAVLLAHEVEALYKVRYGLFGRVGIAQAKMEQNATGYRIVVEGKATGLAGVLSGGRIERYESRGRVVDGKLVPDYFVKIRQNRNKRSVKEFFFNHAKGEVTITKRNYKKGKLVATTHSKLPYYAPNDLLSLYFNIAPTLHTLQGQQRFYAVGGDRNSGAVDIIAPTGKELAKLKRLLKVDGTYLIAVIHQKIFASKEGRLYIVLDSDGIAKKALLKDVILFGDIVGKLVEKKVHP